MLPEDSSGETDNLADIHNHFHKYVLCNDALVCGNVEVSKSPTSQKNHSKSRHRIRNQMNELAYQI